MFVIKKKDIIKKKTTIKLEGDYDEIIESEVVVHFLRPTIKTGRWYRKHTRAFFKLASNEKSTDEEIYTSSDEGLKILKEHIVGWSGFVTETEGKSKSPELEYSSQNFDTLVNIPPVLSAFNGAFSDLILTKVVNEADKAKNSESSAEDGSLAA